MTSAGPLGGGRSEPSRPARPGEPEQPTEPVEPVDAQLEGFWERARRRARLTPAAPYLGVTPLGALRPPAWAFGATRVQADSLLALVLAGTKTATASAAWDYAAEDEPLPQVGTLGIVVDGAGRPRALLVTTRVRVVPFMEVDAAHAAAEGEGDLSLRYWREVHAAFFGAHGSRRFEPDMDVVLEDFRVLHQE